MRRLVWGAILLSTASCITLVDPSKEDRMNFEGRLSPEFKEVFNRTWNPQFFTDWSGRMLAANPRCGTLFGVSKNTRWPNTFMELLDIPEHERGEFLLMVQTTLRRMSQKDRPLVVEVGYVSDNGQPFPFRTTTEIFDLRSTHPETLFFSISVISPIEGSIDVTSSQMTKGNSNAVTFP